MALEVLSIPAMSTEPERVFSGAKITMSDRQCRLGDNIIEALECRKSWEREGLILECILRSMRWSICWRHCIRNRWPRKSRLLEMYY
jgi:hypothetical protein